MATTLAAGRAANPERRFYQAMILVILACIVLGFSRSFFLRPLFLGVHAPTEAWFYFHGAIFTLWLALLFTQASLIGNNNVALHQRLGVTAFGLVPLMIFMGLVGALIAARRPGGFIDIPVPPLQFMIVPFADMLWFGVLAGLALTYRREPQVHKRLILLASIALTEAGIARWPFEPYISSPPLAFWTKTLLLLPMVGWDLYSRKRVHPVTLWGGLFLISEGPVRDYISQTALWLAFAKWATGLLGP
jgi:uncharacterized membrane protein YozB (DUF420 family)